MQVLCFLLRHQGQVVSREFIAQSLWPDTVVGLDVITRAIFELRKILNDSAQSPQFIETIARKGYCFIYPLEQKSVGEGSVDCLVESYESTPSYKWPLFVALSVAVILIVVVVGFFLTRYDPDRQVHQFRSTLLTHSDRQVEMPALSPSQKSVLFIQSFPENRFNQVFLMDLQTNKKVALTEQDAIYRFPLWGASGKYIYYIKCIKRDCQLIQDNIESREKEVLFSRGEEITSFDISPLEQEVVLNVKEGGSQRLALLDFDKPEPLYMELTDGIHRMPKYSLDGSSVFFVTSTSNGYTVLNQYHLADGVVEQLNSDFHSILSVEPMSDNQLWISGKRDGRFAIWSMSLGSKELEQVIDNHSSEYQSQLSSANDGTFNLVYKNWHRNINIEQYGLADYPQMLNSDVIDINAIYSPEIKAFFSVSNRSGSFEIWQHKVNESQQMTRLKANSLGQPLLSQDSKQLAFLNKKSAFSELTILDIESQQPLMSYQVPVNTHLLEWSNRSETLYVSVLEQKQYTLAMIDLSNGKLTKLVVNAGGFVKEPTDGNGLIYVDMSNGQLMRTNSLSETKRIVDLLSLNVASIPRGLMLTEQWLYYVVLADEGPRVMRYELSSSEVSLYAQLPKGSVVTQLGGGDKPFVIFDRRIEDESKIILLESEYD